MLQYLKMHLYQINVCNTIYQSAAKANIVSIFSFISHRDVTFQKLMNGNHNTSEKCFPCKQNNNSRGLERQINQSVYF